MISTQWEVLYAENILVIEFRAEKVRPLLQNFLCSVIITAEFP